MRVGHADRDRIIEILNVATGEGRLTLEELETRIEAASRARYESDLDALIADLPEGRARRDREVELSQRAQLPVPSDALAPPGSLALTAAWAAVIRAGRWQVPEWILAEPQWAAVVLNFLDAIPPPGGVINIELRMSWGSFVMILPEGWGLDRRGLTAKSVWSSATFDAPEVPSQGKPLVRLMGRQGDGRLSVRGERWWDKYLHKASKN